MAYYKRESNSGHIVEWIPEHDSLAKQAVVDVSGTGINSTEEAQSEYAEVDRNTAKRVQERYNELLRDKDDEN